MKGRRASSPHTPLPLHTPPGHVVPTALAACSLQTPAVQVEAKRQSVSEGHVLPAHRSTAEGAGDGRRPGIRLVNALATSGQGGYIGGN